MYRIRIVLNAVGLLLLSLTGEAVATCALEPVPDYMATGPVSVVAPLDSRIFSVPPDLPVGAQISKMYINMSNNPTGWHIKCTSGNTLYLMYLYDTLPGTLVPGFSDVYKTDLDGIGVRYLTNYASEPSFPFWHIESVGMEQYIPASIQFKMGLQFIKTANVTQAGIITATKLPSIRIAAGQSGQVVYIAKLSVSGNFEVNTPTCNIAPLSANMSVQMGEHNKKVFKGVGTGSPWKNASIQLISCQRFYGNMPTGDSSSSINGVTTTNPLTLNSVSLTLTPRNGMVDATKGIMKIDEETGKATGVGIQLSTTESTTGIINLNEKLTTSIPNSASTTLTLPLYARYVQTESSVNAGTANGRLEYTVTYQ